MCYGMLYDMLPIGIAAHVDHDMQGTDAQRCTADGAMRYCAALGPSLCCSQCCAMVAESRNGCLYMYRCLRVALVSESKSQMAAVALKQGKHASMRKAGIEVL